MAIVIDDLGWVRRTASIYDKIDQPLTMAVMPGRPLSRRLYRRWKDKFEFIIHMPMEPLGYPEDDPGRLPLMTGMSDTKIRQRLETVLDRYPDAVGLNNHMGSAFTQDRQGMKVLMKVLSENDLFYFDSRTTSASVAEEIAKKYNVPVIRNQLFLDRKRSSKAIKDQLKRLVDLARENGRAVGIGHIQSVSTAKVLRKKLDTYSDSGVQFVRLSRLIRDSGNSVRSYP